MTRRRCRKSGFSLLELMIALGLLGALLAVAWSLLGTFRDAEMRGWKLSFRTQTIRSARNWLESDMQHLMLDAPPKPSGNLNPTRSATQSNSAAFRGDENGFSATISPSVDPIPFLGNLMSDGNESKLGSTTVELALSEDMSDEAIPASLWPADAVEIEYELVPMDSDPTAASTSADGLLDLTQYALVRREQLGAGKSAQMELPSERLLTAQDLYRQEGDDRLAPTTPMNETRLEGLMHPQFRYFDGTKWSKQWNSSQRGGLPRAIAFGFDFPASKDLIHPSDRVPPLESESDRLPSSSLPTDTLFQPTDSSEESLPERTDGDNQGIMISSTNEVQLVIYVGGNGGQPASSPNAPMPNAIQRGQAR